MNLVPTNSEAPSLSLAQAFDVLAKASTVAFGGVGFAGGVLPETTAFDTVVAAGASARPQLEQLLTDATPAGKIYAATALHRLDPNAGLAAWRQLTTDTAEVTTASGCLIDRRTVAQYATEQLNGDEQA